MSTRLYARYLLASLGVLVSCSLEGCADRYADEPDHGCSHAALASACNAIWKSMERQARLYPANDIARADGVLTATFEAQGTGNGSVIVVTPDGDSLRGEFSIVRGGAVGFGSIFGQVYGPDGTATVSGDSTTRVMPGSSPGMASAFSAATHTSMDCEFYNDNVSGHGMGACRSSKGALYRLQY